MKKELKDYFTTKEKARMYISYRVKNAKTEIDAYFAEASISIALGKVPCDKTLKKITERDKVVFTIAFPKMKEKLEDCEDF